MKLFALSAKAQNEFIDLEDRSHDELDEIKSKFANIAAQGP